MFLKLTRQFGKPICVVLYAVFAALAAKKKPIALIALFATHLVETLTIGRRVASEKGVGTAAWLVNCLAFGFTWWLPLKKD